MLVNKKSIAVSLEEVSKGFFRKKVLDNVRFSVDSGVIMGVLGPNGSGKTTLLNIIAGLYKPGQGRVLVEGLPPSRKTRQRIAYVPEYDYLYSWMKVEEHLHFLAAFYPDWNDQVATELLEFMGLDSREVVGNLSRGLQARLKLISCMARSAPLILLDEPFSGIDPVSRRLILEAILQRFQGVGQTIILSTHEIHEIEPLLDQVMFSCQMRLINSQVLLKLNSGATGSTYKLYGINSHVQIELDPETPVRISIISLNSHSNIEELAWERKQGYYLSPGVEWREEGITLKVCMLSGSLTLLPAI